MHPRNHMRPPVLNDPDIGTMYGSLVPLRGEFEPRGAFPRVC